MSPEMKDKIYFLLPQEECIEGNVFSILGLEVAHHHCQDPFPWLKAALNERPQPVVKRSSTILKSLVSSGFFSCKHLVTVVVGEGGGEGREGGGGRESYHFSIHLNKFSMQYSMEIHGKYLN